MAAPAETIAWLKQTLGDACESVSVQGDRPLLLDDPSCAYLTLSDYHQLFCVGYERGRAVGRREHLAVCGPGQLLFGLEPAAGPDATALVLSGVSGSAVWRVPTAQLFRRAEGPDALAAIGALFDAWIELLIATLHAAPVPTRARVVGAGETVDASGGAALHASGSLAWIAPRLGLRSYAGIDTGPPDAGGVWPLSDQAWALCEEEGLRVWRSADIFASTKGASFADGFYRFVVRVVSARRAELADVRLSHDALSRSAEAKRLTESLERLAVVGRGERLRPDAGGADDFERACRFIARWLSAAPPRVVKPEGRTFSHMERALALTTGLRTRRVVLEPGWYRHDNGALLAFGLEGEEHLAPLAVVPSRRGYWMRDPRASVSRTGDAAGGVPAPSSRLPGLRPAPEGSRLTPAGDLPLRERAHRARSSCSWRSSAR